MKRNISNMSMFLGCSAVLNDVVDVVDPPFVPQESNMMNILKEIFCVDERSGLPIGDLSYYLSPDGNPHVKEWLENNLLKPRAQKNGTSLEGVTDDMIAECQRGKDENVHDYQLRLQSIFNECQTIINNSKTPHND